MARALLLLALITSPALAATDPVFGRWLVEDAKAVIQIEPCGNRACGRLVWMTQPWESDGTPKKDVNNPDRAARERPLCGLRLITGLQQAGDGTWRDGEIYSTRDGKTYGFRVEPGGAGKLTVRGFVGVSLLGRSQTWTRDSGRRGTCTNMARPGVDR